MGGEVVALFCSAGVPVGAAGGGVIAVSVSVNSDGESDGDEDGSADGAS